MKKRTQDDYVRTALRVPPELHARVHEAADAAGRTFNAELVQRIDSADAWPRIDPTLRRAIEVSALGNGRSFAEQVESDLIAAHNPLLMRISEVLVSEAVRLDIAKTAEARSASFQQEVVDRIVTPRIGDGSKGSSAANNEHLDRILQHIEQLKSANDEARAKGFVLGASMTAAAATDKYMDREKLLELVDALRQLRPEDLKDSSKAEGLVLGLKSGKRQPKS